MVRIMMPLFDSFFHHSKSYLSSLSRNMILEQKSVSNRVARSLLSPTVPVSSCSPRVPVELTFLGTSSASPTETRNVSSLLFKPCLGTFWMFDCGDGTLRQWNRRPGAHSSPSNKLEVIFITHCHGDHIYGLPSLLMNMLSASSTVDAASPYTAEQPLLIVGPLGIYSLFAPMLASHSRVRVLECSPTVMGSNDSRSHVQRCSLLYPIGSVADASLRFEVYENADWKVLAIPIEHSVLTLGYIVLEKGAQGRKIVILGDTCNPYSTLSFAAKADCLVHECTFLNEHADQAYRTRHSTSQMVGDFARAVQPKTLLLNHISPMYFRDEYHPRAKALLSRLVEQVKESFGAGSGEVVLAHDFMTHTIHPRGIEPSVRPTESVKDNVSSNEPVARLNMWSDPVLSMSDLRHLFKIESGHDNLILDMQDVRVA